MPWVILCLILTVFFMSAAVAVFIHRFDQAIKDDETGKWQFYDGKRDYYASVWISGICWFVVLIIVLMTISFAAKLFTMDATVIYYLHGGVL